MNSTKGIFSLIAIGVLALILNASLFIVKESEFAILLRLGEIVDADYEPGLHFKMPIIQESVVFDKRIQTLDAPKESFLTGEKKFVVVDSFAKWRITDVAQYFRSTRGNPAETSRLLSARINAALRDEFGKRTIQEVVSGERAEIMEKLAREANESAADLGVEIVDVRVKQIDFEDKISENIYERMRTERHRVAAELAALEAPIDVLIHNAGAYLTKREVTADGLETIFVVHHLSSFILNYRLMDKLRAQEKARILIVSSEGHRFAAWGLRLDDLNWEKRRYSGLKSYGSAKLAQLLSMLVFDDRFKQTGITINAMHPGAVKTETGQENGPVYRWFKRNFFDKTLKPAEISAEALYYMGVSKEMHGVSGKFFNLTTEEEPAPPALDREVAEELREKSLELAGLEEMKPATPE